MEFLVRIDVSVPPDLPEDRRRQLVESEATRGAELRDQGTIKRIWRIPGRTANVAIWEAPDPTALHEAISTLPMFPYLKADVTALATHYLEADR